VAMERGSAVFDADRRSIPGLDDRPSEDRPAQFYGILLFYDSIALCFGQKRELRVRRMSAALTPQYPLE
jgi:hypothetical protein